VLPVVDCRPQFDRPVRERPQHLTECSTFSLHLPDALLHPLHRHTPLRCAGRGCGAQLQRVSLDFPPASKQRFHLPEEVEQLHVEHLGPNLRRSPSIPFRGIR